MRPSRERILPELLALLLAADVLLNSLAHDPVRGAAVSCGQALDAGFQFAVELEAGGGGGGMAGAPRCYLTPPYHTLLFPSLSQKSERMGTRHRHIDLEKKLRCVDPDGRQVFFVPLGYSWLT